MCLSGKGEKMSRIQLLFFLFAAIACLAIDMRPATLRRQGQRSKLSSHYNPPAVNNLLAMLREAQTDSQEVVILRDLCWQYRTASLENSVFYGKRGFELARKARFPKLQAEISRFLGLTYRNYYLFEEAYLWYTTALDLSKRAKYLEGEAYCYDNLGVLYYNQRQFRKAEIQLLQGEVLFKNLNHSLGLSYIYTHLSWVMNEYQDYNRALEYAQKSLKARLFLKDKLQIGNARRDVALAQMGLRKYREAELNLNEALTLAESLNNFTAIADYLQSLAVLHLQTKRYDEAQKQAQVSYQLGVDYYSRNQIMKSAKTLAEIAKAQNQMTEAYEFLSIHYTYKDSLFNEDITRKTIELESNIKFMQRERVLESEQRIKDRLAEERINRERFGRFVLTGLLLLAVGMGVLIYRSRRALSNSNTLLQESNQTLALQKQSIQEQAEQLDDLNLFKSKLFSIVSHDLRTPLATLAGSLDLIKEDLMDEQEFKEILPELSSNVNNIQNLLDNLLTWARGQMRGQKIAPEKFDLSLLIKEKMDLYGQMAAQKQLQVKDQSENGLRVYADKNMVDLVLRNLFSNAIKFSRINDHITLRSARENGHVMLEISDTGIGIPPDNMKKLFTNQALSTRGTHGEAGTGLGLQLCKEFLEKNGGKIQVKSQAGQGSTFTITLPAAN
jgi:two-component system, sensor histidine kinase and response regulator